MLEALWRCYVMLLLWHCNAPQCPFYCTIQLHCTMTTTPIPVVLLNSLFKNYNGTKGSVIPPPRSNCPFKSSSTKLYTFIDIIAWLFSSRYMNYSEGNVEERTSSFLIHDASFYQVSSSGPFSQSFYLYIFSQLSFQAAPLDVISLFPQNQAHGLINCWSNDT